MPRHETNLSAEKYEEFNIFNTGIFGIAAVIDWEAYRIKLRLDSVGKTNREYWAFIKLSERYIKLTKLSRILEDKVDLQSCDSLMNGLQGKN